jgi:hypothetical protein
MLALASPFTMAPTIARPQAARAAPPGPPPLALTAEGWCAIRASKLKCTKNLWSRMNFRAAASAIAAVLTGSEDEKWRALPLVQGLELEASVGLYLRRDPSGALRGAARLAVSDDSNDPAWFARGDMLVGTTGQQSEFSSHLPAQLAQKVSDWMTANLVENGVSVFNPLSNRYDRGSLSTLLSTHWYSQGGEPAHQKVRVEYSCNASVPEPRLAWSARTKRPWSTSPRAARAASVMCAFPRTAPPGAETAPINFRVRCQCEREVPIHGSIPLYLDAWCATARDNAERAALHIDDAGERAGLLSMSPDCKTECTLTPAGAARPPGSALVTPAFDTTATVQVHHLGERRNVLVRDKVRQRFKLGAWFVDVTSVTQLINIFPSEANVVQKLARGTYSLLNDRNREEDLPMERDLPPQADGGRPRAAIQRQFSEIEVELDPERAETTNIGGETLTNLLTELVAIVWLMRSVCCEMIYDEASVAAASTTPLAP